MAFRSQFKRTVLFSISVQVLMSLAPLAPAHAGLKEWCEFALGQRSSPRLSEMEKWQRAARRDPRWRPTAARYYERHTEPYKAAVDPRYWYLPGNVAYDEALIYFPQFVREYQKDLRGETLPPAELLLAYRKHGPNYQPPKARRWGAPGYRPPESGRRSVAERRRDEERRREDDRRRRSDDDSYASSPAWDYSPSPTPSEPSYSGHGGSSGGAGATGQWDSTPSPSHSPSYSHSPSSSHSHSPSHSHSHDSGSSYGSSSSDSSSSSSSSDSGSSSSSDGGGGGGGGD